MITVPRDPLISLGLFGRRLPRATANFIVDIMNVQKGPPQ
jgi:hypothetical protein